MDIKQEEERLKKQFKKNRSSVRNRRASTPSTPPCYNIGDIGPGGGIVFALPNTGINNSNFVYEINADPIQLATTPFALLPNKCRNQKPLTIKTRDVGQTVPNNAIVVDYGPGSNNPTFFPSDVNVGDILNAFDINGNGLFSPGVIPTVTLKTLLPNNFVFIAFSAFMNGPANSQPSEAVTFYTTPGSVPVNGAEWGGYDQPIITSELFGEGKKNTDIIAAVTQTNNPPSHPTVPSHDIAADLTLAFSQNNLDDWFLPSYEELEEAFNVLGSNGLDMLPNPPGINDEKTVYWTSTGLNPVNNQLAGNVNSNELAWAYITPFNTTFLYRKCKTLSVLPVRRFECKVIDKGIQYDYRLAKTARGSGAFTFNGSLGSPGVIGFMGDDQPQNLGDTYSAGATLAANGQDFSGFSQPSTMFPNGIGAGTVVINIDYQATQNLLNLFMANISIGQILDPPFDVLGPVMYININTTGFSGNNLVFGNWGTSGTVYATLPNPIGSVITNPISGNQAPYISYNTLYQNPAWFPSTFGNGRQEVGRPYLSIDLSAWDIRLNNLKQLKKTQTLSPVKLLFNIKVYNQYEELLGDWDYKLGSPYQYNFCSLTYCRWNLQGDLVNTNYVNPNYATNTSQPNVVDINNLFGRCNGQTMTPTGNPASFFHGQETPGYPDGDEGHGYVSIELIQTEYTYDTSGMVIPLRWSNYNPPGYMNGRGNSANLQNWMGMGLNRRITDPNNPPPEWNSFHKRFGWGTVCMPCGTGTSYGCVNGGIKEWFAELPYSSFTHFIPPYFSPSLTYSCPPSTPNHVSVLNGGSWGSWWVGSALNTGWPGATNSLGYIDNSWSDLMMGHLCFAGNVVGDNQDVSSQFNSKLIEIDTKEQKNYTEEIKACINENELLDEDIEKFEIILDHPNDSVIGEIKNQRVVFTDNNKEKKETGPFAIAGYYPLYDTIEAAKYNSIIPLEARDGEDTYGYHIHEFNGVEYYMPNGLQMGITQFHGDYDGQIIEELKTEITQEVVEQEEEITYIQPQQEVQEQETQIVLPEEDEEPPPTPTYTPPPSTPSGGSSSGSGGY